MVIDAAAGMGKSRLARAGLAQAGHDGAVTTWVQATRSAASIPLGAFAEILPPDVGSGDPFELLHRAATAIRERAGRRRMVIGVDDAQLLDPTSATLVAHLASTAAASLLVTVRTGEVCPDAVVSLWKDGDLQRLALSALTESETAELVESVVGGTVEENARRWVWEVSRGNPLYARELALGARAGALRNSGDLWRMPSRPAIAASLTELIAARLTQLTADERGALELLALGEPLELSSLIRLTAGGTTLTGLEERELISVEAGDAGPIARLGHPLFGEVMRTSLPFLRGREIRLALAADLQRARSLSGHDALRVARLLLDAGEPVPVSLLVDAAQAATLSGDADLGRVLAQRAIDAGAGLDATLVLARSLTISNGFEDAAAVLAAAERDVVTQDGAIDYLEQQLAVLYWGLRRTDELQALLERARHWWPDDAWKARLAPLRLRVGLLESLDQPGDELAETVDRLEHDDLDATSRRQLEVVLLAGLLHSGRGREAYALGRRTRPELPLAGPTDEGILALWIAAASETGEGWEEFEAWARQALRTGVRLGDHGGAGLAAIVLGHLSFHQARYLDARRWLAEAQMHHEHHDPIGVMANTASLQAGVAFALDDSEAARAALARCSESLRGDRPPPFQLPSIALARAWTALATGDLAQGQGTLLDAAAELSALPHYAARMVYEAMRAGVPACDVTIALDALSRRCDSRLVAVRAAHVRHRAADDGLGLLGASSEFESIGALLYASEAAAHAAESFLNAGRQDSARRASIRSRDLLPAGQGAEPPRIRGIDPAVIELTRREAELVKLARNGLSNGEIAERLVLSSRTVESHLYRAMQKLGVSDRRDL